MLRGKIMALLFKRSIFAQDSRDRLCVTRDNDWCWGRWLSVCYKFLKRIYHTGFSANELALKAKNDHRSALQCGRSMIEMLGVLAIIVVLSVGGIAGYSKAMSMYKMDKWKAQIADLVFSTKDAYKNEKKYGNPNENILILMCMQWLIGLIISEFAANMCKMNIKEDIHALTMTYNRLQKNVKFVKNKTVR